MARVIDADRLEYYISSHRGTYLHKEDVIAAIANQPTVDAAEVVRCLDCEIHGHCITEDAFTVSGISNPFCCAGKRKNGVE